MKWVLAESDNEAASRLAESAGLPLIVAKLLVNRGITGPDAAERFLASDLSRLSDPGIFSHMSKAVDRIRMAITANEKIVVYGDYDVDGVTGASLLYLALRQLGAMVSCYIPDRLSEGYGLNARALEKLRTSGVGLVISVDCGITAVREAESARTLGLDLIITDHHEFEQSGRSAGSNGPNDATLPAAYAILHPGLLLSGTSPAVCESVSCLTGVGVAFKLAQALLNAGPGDARLLSFLDLVTLGTVADVGRIVGENRILVRHGLAALSADTGTQRPGIAALIQVSGLKDRKIGVGTIGFTLAPRINASGRIERADTAFELLTTDSMEKAHELASSLDEVNKERQAVESGVCEEARSQCRAFDTQAAGALVLCSEEWHPGVIGIVASRIVEEFYRPAALISMQNGVGKGSARSIPGFDLYEGLSACADLLLGFGGHKYAAGFTIAKENIQPFRERLGSLVIERMGAAGFIRTLTVDSAVTLDELTMDLMRELERLAPFGQGNPEPRLGARDLTVVSSRAVGVNHMKLRLRQRNGVALDAIAFNRGDLLGNQVKDGVRLAVVFTPRINTWNNRTAVELELRDLKVETNQS
jgi:single-stranded-DNA-specific exonuclease